MLTKARANFFHTPKRILGIICTFGLVSQLAGCAPSVDLDEANRKLGLANQKIGELEAQLAATKTGTTGATNLSAQQSSVPTPAPLVAEQPAPEPEIGKQWNYGVTEQQMTGGKRKIATVESTNTVDFGFPYSGAQNGRLTLRTDPQYGKDIIFRLEKGQILCPSYEGCSVQVRFDEEKPVNFAATAAADHSSNLVFIDDYVRFVAKLQKSKRVRMSVNIYQQGRPVFEFDVSGFNIGKFQGTKG
jgi:hypothetical protein